MLTGLFSTTNALQSFQLALDTSANNLANIRTNAFKGSRTLFQDLAYIGSTYGQIGTGDRVGAFDRDFAQGEITVTGNDWDLAIQGEGFFAVQMPSGTTQYTRNGEFSVNASHQLVNVDGLPVQPPITVPADTTSVEVDSDGTVSVLTDSSPTTPIVLGQLRLTKFPNPKGLHAVGGNRFVQTDSSGLPITNLPGTAGLGAIRQRAIEQSNVETSTELVRLSQTSRDYVANTRAVRIEDQLVQSALNMIG